MTVLEDEKNVFGYFFFYFRIKNLFIAFIKIIFHADKIVWSLVTEKTSFPNLILSMTASKCLLISIVRPNFSIMFNSSG